MTVKIRLGKRIQYLREKAGLSQKELALEADLDRSYIAGIESGRRNVSIVNIEKISNALKMPLREFFNTEEFDGY